MAQHPVLIFDHVTKQAGALGQDPRLAAALAAAKNIQSATTLTPSPKPPAA
jgi:hypothetical protein